MINLKTDEEIKLMEEGGAKLRTILQQLVANVCSGITTKSIDDEAERLIIKAGGKPSFKTVKGYDWTTCVPINEQVVHTPPSKRTLKAGDVLTIDIGMYYKGFHTDTATTVVVDNKTSQEIEKFLAIGKDTLDKAIAIVKADSYLGEVSQLIENEIYGHKYFILKELTGHGIGRELHEDPFVFGYVNHDIKKTYRMRPGLVLAIEIIYSMGTEKISYEKGDQWSIITKDRSLSACFEHTVAITGQGTVVLT